MTLATHMVAGTAAAKVFSNHPVEAFLIGWVSHYLLDAVIHWDYPLSITGGEEFAPINIKTAPKKLIAYDVAKVLTDVAIGAFFLVILAWNFSPQNIVLVVLGALGGTVPDFLQFLYGVFKVRVLEVLQNFHNFMHAKKTLKKRPILGIAIQLCVICVAGFFLWFQL